MTSFHAAGLAYHIALERAYTNGWYRLQYTCTCSASCVLSPLFFTCPTYSTCPSCLHLPFYCSTCPGLHVTLTLLIQNSLYCIILHHLSYYSHMPYMYYMSLLYTNVATMSPIYTNSILNGQVATSVSQGGANLCLLDQPLTSVKKIDPLPSSLSVDLLNGFSRAASCR
jgi:hypothetical protein